MNTNGKFLEFHYTKDLLADSGLSDYDLESTTYYAQRDKNYRT